MSFVVLHMDKFKKEAVRGIQSHNQRERKSHSNPDIDRGRSHLNYDLVNSGSVNFDQKIQTRIDELDLKKSVRHDAVYMCGLIVSSDAEFFQNLDETETRRFFEESKNFLAEFVGPENVISTVVHLDEKTPHLHFTHVPVTQDGHLSANKIYTRASLKKLQNDLPAYLREHGFNIQRGVEQIPGAAKKHLDTREFKQQQDAVKNLRSQAETEAENLKGLQARNLESEAAWAEREERIQQYERLAQEAEAFLQTNHELPQPKLMNAKVVHEEALKIIHKYQEALAVKTKVEKRNQYLEEQQRAVDEKIAAIEKETARRIAHHEGMVQALKKSRQDAEASHKNLMMILNRNLGQPEDQNIVVTAHILRERERQEEERQKEARRMEKQRAMQERWAKKKEEAASKPAPEPKREPEPEPEKKSFALGR